MNKILTNFIIIMYFCAIVFILPLNIGGTTIYIGTILNMCFIMFIIININKINFNRNEKLMLFFIMLYLVFSIINLIIIKENYIVYTLNKMIPIITFILLIGVYNTKQIDIERILKYVFVFSNFIVVASLILFLIGFSGITKGNGRIMLISREFFLSSYGETRMTWIFTHKSRFAVFCLMNIGVVLLNNKISNKGKAALLLISIVDIYFSSTKTIFILTIFTLFMCFIKNIFRTKKLKLLKYSSIIFALIGMFLIVPRVVYSLSQTRDVNSLGGRLYIWLAGISKLKDNLFGIGMFKETDWLISDKLPGGVYTNAHNMFINEAIERGLLPGIIFIFIFIVLMYMLRKSKSKYIVISCIASAMMDNTLTSEISYIFWMIVFLYYTFYKSVEYGRDKQQII